MHGEVDHNTNIRHARRKWPDTRDRDRENILAANRLLDGGDRRVEALDMADHQSQTSTVRRCDDLKSLLDRRGYRLLDQNMNAARDTSQREFTMKMCRRSDGHRVDAGGE